MPDFQDPLLRPPPPPPPPDTCLLNSRPQQPVAAHLEDAQTCWLRGLPLSPQPHRVQLRKVHPILQRGPTCGPVALAMSLAGALSPETLVGMAQKAGLSANGEIFSCDFMAQLARDAAARTGMPLQVSVHDNLFSEYVVQELLEEAVLLVPYDSDRNFDPCLRRGHKAHWALIVGVFEQKYLPPEPGRRINMKEDNVYVLARHGKSKRLVAWSLAELASSNRNLCEFPVHRVADGLRYVVPEGGVGGENGLRSRFVLMKGL